MAITLHHPGTSHETHPGKSIGQRLAAMPGWQKLLGATLAVAIPSAAIGIGVTGGGSSEGTKKLSISERLTQDSMSSDASAFVLDVVSAAKDFKSDALVPYVSADLRDTIGGTATDFPARLSSYVNEVGDSLAYSKQQDPAIVNPQDATVDPSGKYIDLTVGGVHAAGGGTSLDVRVKGTAEGTQLVSISVNQPAA